MAYHYRIPSSATLRERIARRQAEIAELRALLDVAHTRELAAVAHGLRAHRPRTATPPDTTSEHDETVRS